MVVNSLKSFFKLLSDIDNIYKISLMQTTDKVAKVLKYSEENRFEISISNF